MDSAPTAGAGINGRPGDAPATVHGRALCPVCETDLDGRPTDEACPGCGSVIGEVLPVDLLRDADRAWIESIRRGMAGVHRSLAAGAATFFVLCVIWFVMRGLGAPIEAVVVVFGIAAVVLLGCWAAGTAAMVRIATVEPDINRSDIEMHESMLALLRWLTVLIPAATAAAFLMLVLHEVYGVPIGLMIPVDGLAVLAMTVFIMLYGRWMSHLLARCAATGRRTAGPVRRVLRWYRWAPLGCGVLFALAWGLWLTVYVLTYATSIRPLDPPFFSLWVLIIWLICLVPTRRAKQVIDDEIAARDAAAG